MTANKTEKQVVELLITMKEGVEHLKKELARGEVEGKLYMFTDLMEAFAAVESIITKDGKADKVKAELKELRRCFDVITSAYEKGNTGNVRSYFVFSFKKAFDEWFKLVMKEYN